MWIKDEEKKKGLRRAKGPALTWMWLKRAVKWERQKRKS